MAKPKPKPVKPVVKMLKLIDITVDPDLQSRDEADGAEAIAETLADYREVVRANKKFREMPVVYEDKAAGKNWLSEGFLRFQAHLDERRTRMECEVRQGTRLDALLNSAGSNSQHGLPRTNRDKRRAVEMVMRACPTWNMQKVAFAAGVTPQYVGKVKKGDAQTPCLETVSKQGVEPTPVQQSPAAESDPPKRANFWGACRSTSA